MSFTRGLMCPHTDDDISSTSGGRNKCTCGKVVTNSSLFTAAEWGEMERIRTLVEVRGKDVNLLDSGGYTMLHYAAQHNRVEVVRYVRNTLWSVPCVKTIVVTGTYCHAMPELIILVMERHRYIVQHFQVRLNHANFYSKRERMSTRLIRPTGAQRLRSPRPQSKVIRML